MTKTQCIATVYANSMEILRSQNVYRKISFKKLGLGQATMPPAPKSVLGDVHLKGSIHNLGQLKSNALDRVWASS